MSKFLAAIGLSNTDDVTMTFCSSTYGLYKPAVFIVYCYSEHLYDIGSMQMR